MKSEIKILNMMLDNKLEKYTIKKISEITGLNYRIAYEKIMLLTEEGLIKIENAGNSRLCNLTNKFNNKLFESEIIRKNELLKNKNLIVMLDSFSRLSTKLFVLLVFGSYAKKTHTKHSDIDLMFIVPNESLEKEINNIASTLPLNIHLNIFTEDEFKAMKNSKEITVGSEAMNNNIILHGVESYYEMIQ